MVRNLIIRGFDDEVHSQLGELSRRKGVSINSIVRDAVDKWLKQQKEIPKRHHLLIYDNVESMKWLLKSVDKLAKEGEWFRCFMKSFDSPITDLLKKLGWFEGATNALFPDSHEDIKKYCADVVEKILQNSNNDRLCCMDFLINDIAKNSLKVAIELEKAYDNNRLEGLMFCTYKTDNLLNSSVRNIMDIFESHEQTFILKDEQVYKLHLTKENAHKLFLS
jgi:hypothetical protein